jgi:predicted amidophosphoribosyltransferase
MSNTSAIIGMCGYCRGVLYLGDRFCPSCGAPIEKSICPENVVSYPSFYRGQMICFSDGPMPCSTSDSSIEFVWG